MRKSQLYKKRILSLVLSLTMVFASTDTYAALAAEAEKTEVIDYGDSQLDSAEAESSAESDVHSENVTDSSETEGNTSGTTMENDENTDDANNDTSDDENANVENPDENTDNASDTADEEDGAEVTEADAPDSAEEIAADENGFTVDDSGKLTAYTGEGGDITIPDGVVTIGSGVFQGNKTITSVIFPDSVKKIESSAFSGCTGLYAVELNEGLETIERKAFENAAFGYKKSTGAIEYGTLEIPGSVQYIGYEAFQGCIYLNEVTFSEENAADVLELDTLYSYYSSAFAGCPELEKAVLPDRLKVVSSSLFNGDSKLKEVQLGNSVETIGDSVFEGCSSLQGIDLPQTVTGIGSSAFKGCSSLAYANLNDGLVTIGNSAFENAAFGSVASTGKITYGTLEIPGSVQYIGYEAFQGCIYLNEVTFSEENAADVLELDTLYSYYSSAFAGCPELEKAVLPDRLKVVSSSLFNGDSKLKEVQLGNAVETIGDSVFEGCSSLQGIDLPQTVTGIGSSAFKGCSSLAYANLNDGLVTIGNSAFENAAFGSVASTGKITYGTLEIPGSVQYIGYSAFQGCTYLKEVTFSEENAADVLELDTMYSYYSSVFADCPELEKAVLPDRLKVVNISLFSGDSKLKEVQLGNSVETIKSKAFYECSSLQGIDLPQTVTLIESYAFKGCSSLEYANLNEGLKTIENNAFDSAKISEAFTIPSTVQSIGSDAFSGSSLTEVVFENGETVVLTLQNAFRNCASLKTVILPDRLESIQSGTFYSCENLEMLYIPETVTTIASNAISNCPKLTIYGVTGTAAETYAKDNGIPFKSSQELGTTVTGVSLNITQISRFNEDAIGETIKLTATVTPVTAKNKTVTYASSNAAVATVDNTGLVTLTGFGNANITVTTEDGGKTASCRVTIMNLFSDDNDDDSVFDEDERVDLAELEGTIAKIKAKTYDGLPYKPTVKVTVRENGKKKTLVEGTDYRVTYEDYVDVGIGKAIVWGNGQYNGHIEQTFEIEPKSIKKLTIVTGSMVVGDTASDIPIYIYDGTTRLIENVDYALSGTENITAQASKGVKVTITALPDSEEQNRNYTGSKTVKIPVYDTGGTAKKVINPLDVTLKDEDQTVTYTGKAIKPEPYVVVDGATLTKNKDYKVQYKNNKNAGTALVIVTGKGSYTGTVVTAFTITPNDTNPLVITNKTIKAKIYNGKLQKPSVTVKSGTKNLKKNKDYTVSYKNNLHVGTAIIIVTGIGNYKGAEPASYTFDINPQKISKISVKGTMASGLTITYSKHLLKEGTDYKLTYGEVKKNNIKVTVSAMPDSDFNGDVTKTVKIVNKGEEVNVPQLKDANKTIKKNSGETYQLEFEDPDEVVLSVINWESSDPDVVSVSDEGLLTMHKAGTVVIEVTAYGAFTQQCFVIVDEDELNDAAYMENDRYIKCKKKEGSTNDSSKIRAYIDELDYHSYDGIYVTAGVYFIDAVKYPIDLSWRSNVNWIMSPGAILMAIPNNSKNYHVILAYDCDNIHISGGKIIGERYEHTGKGGEWGHGIGLYECTNSSVSDVEISECWGDGITVGAMDEDKDDTTCSNITITNCNLHDNRRNNLSITAGDYVTIDGCKFNYAKGTDPQYGIDIETNNKKNPNEHITIKNSEMIGNAKGSLRIETVANDIRLDNCTLSGVLYNTAGKNVVIHNSKIGSVVDLNNGVRYE